MAKNMTKTAKREKEEPIVDRPAASLVRSWTKRMSQGGVPMIPVFIGGSWSLAVQRGNKRILQFSLTDKNN